MTYTVMLFLTRHHSLTSEQFRDQYENVHIPLAYSLLSHCWPITFHRHYPTRINRKGFGGPSNPDRPPLMLRGFVSDDLDCDCIAKTTFEDEAHFFNFYRSVYAKDTSALLTRAEENFLEEGKTKIMVIGETWSTDRAGMTSKDISLGLISDPLDSDDTNSSQSS